MQLDEPRSLTVSRLFSNRFSCRSEMERSCNLELGGCRFVWSIEGQAIAVLASVVRSANSFSLSIQDVVTDTCAICRVIVMDACLKCQGRCRSLRISEFGLSIANRLQTNRAFFLSEAENKPDDCVVVWGDCSHVFHNCKQTSRLMDFFVTAHRGPLSIG